MKVKIVSTKKVIATHGGNLLLGELLAKTSLAERINILTKDVIPTDKGITTGDVITTYVGMLCQAQPEFEAAEQFREDEYYTQSLGITRVPSCSKQPEVGRHWRTV